MASYLHEEIIEKIKNSPPIGKKKRVKCGNYDTLINIGWMFGESTSRCVEKSVIIYVRYFDKDEARTSFYGIVGLDGDGSANNIVKCTKSLWRKDDLNPEKRVGSLPIMRPLSQVFRLILKIINFIYCKC